MTVVYKSADVMKRLGLKESVFKKYYLALEKEGYVIPKNSSNHRVFSEEHIQILETFVQMIKYDGMTVESVAKQIAKAEGHIVTDQNKESYDVMSLVASALEKELAIQEKQMTNRMQEILEQRLEEQEKRLTAKFSAIEESNKRIEESLDKMSKKKWWQFW